MASCLIAAIAAIYRRLDRHQLEGFPPWPAARAVVVALVRHRRRLACRPLPAATVLPDMGARLLPDLLHTLRGDAADAPGRRPPGRLDEGAGRTAPRRRHPARCRRGRSTCKRVAALPGDRIEMREGIVILNRRPVAQRPLGDRPGRSRLDGRARATARRAIPRRGGPAPDLRHRRQQRRRHGGATRRAGPCLRPRRQSRPQRRQPLHARRDGASSSRRSPTFAAAPSSISGGRAGGWARRSTADYCGRIAAKAFPGPDRASIVGQCPPPPTSRFASSPATRCSKGRWSRRRSRSRRSGSISPPRR